MATKKIFTDTNIKAAQDQKTKEMMYSAAMLSIMQDAEKHSTQRSLDTKANFQYPQVMGLDGKPTTADKVAQSITSDMMLDSSPINNIGGGLSQFNEFYFNRINTLLIDNIFLGYAEYSLLAQNGVLYNMCNTPATEMTREWIEFVNTGKDDKTDKIAELEREYERLNVRDLFQRAAFFTFSQGGILMYPKLRGDEENNELQQELYIDNMKIGKGDLEYLTLIEPIWYVPIRYITDNPLSKWFYKPEFWTAMGRILHSSRVFQFIHNEAPNIIKPQYNFNGIPMMQQAIPFVMPFETMRNTIIEIVQKLNLTVLKTGLQAIVTGAGTQDPNTNCNAGANLGTRIRALNATRTNSGTLAIDMENEDIMNLTMSLQGLDELFSRYAEMMCIIPKLPATEFLGVSPRGFNATGEFEMKKYHRHIRSLQEQVFRPHLIKIHQLAQLNIWGEIDPDIKFEFKKLDEANELEESTIRLNAMTEATGYAGAGIVTPEEVRTKIQDDESSGWNGLEELQEEDENEELEYKPPTTNLSGTNRGAKSNEPLGVAASWTSENNGVAV